MSGDNPSPGLLVDTRAPPRRQPAGTYALDGRGTGTSQGLPSFRFLVPDYGKRTSRHAGSEARRSASAKPSFGSNSRHVGSPAFRPTSRRGPAGPAAKRRKSSRSIDGSSWTKTTAATPSRRVRLHQGREAAVSSERNVVTARSPAADSPMSSASAPHSSSTTPVTMAAACWSGE